MAVPMRWRRSGAGPGGVELLGEGERQRAGEVVPTDACRHVGPGHGKRERVVVVAGQRRADRGSGSFGMAGVEHGGRRGVSAPSIGQVAPCGLAPDQASAAPLELTWVKQGREALSTL